MFVCSVWGSSVKCGFECMSSRTVAGWGAAGGAGGASVGAPAPEVAAAVHSAAAAPSTQV